MEKQLEVLNQQLNSLTKDETTKKDKESQSQKLQESIYRLRSSINSLTEKFGGCIEEINELKELGTGTCPTCRQEISGVCPEGNDQFRNEESSLTCCIKDEEVSEKG